MDSQQFDIGIVYVLTNPAMPGIVKIGKTSRNTVDQRLNELYSTGVPVPFDCAFAGRVADYSRVEKAFHLAFGPYRINEKREFFEIEPEQAIALLELLVDEDVTPEIANQAEKVDVNSKSASNRLKARRPVLNFFEMGLQQGDTLHFLRGDYSCQILNGRKVEYDNQTMSLTALTKQLLDTNTSLQPCPHWSFNGKNLSEIYDETYSLE